MNKIRIAIALLAIVFISSNGVHAQTPAAKTAPVAPAPDLSKLNIESVLQQLQTTNTEPSGEEPTPVQVIAAFLQLRPDQISALEQLLLARQTALVPLAQRVQVLTQQLGNLLSSGGNPAQVGVLVIQIHGTQQQMAMVQQSFVSQFLSTLDPAQTQKIQAVEIAVQLRPVLPAFKLVFLF